jgi:hypothetical protein
VIGGADIGVEEEVTGVFVRPIFRDAILGFTSFDSGDEFLDGAVFTNDFESRIRADLGDRV